MRPADLQFLADLAAKGAFRPVIDRCYPLAGVAEAHAYVDTGHKRERGADAPTSPAGRMVDHKSGQASMAA